MKAMAGADQHYSRKVLEAGELGGQVGMVQLESWASDKPKS